MTAFRRVVLKCDGPTPARPCPNQQRWETTLASATAARAHARVGGWTTYKRTPKQVGDRCSYCTVHAEL